MNCVVCLSTTGQEEGTNWLQEETISDKGHFWIEAVGPKFCLQPKNRFYVLAQWFSLGVILASQGTFINVWRRFWMSQWGGSCASGILWDPTPHPCTAPKTKNDPATEVISAEVRNHRGPDPGEGLPLQTCFSYLLGSSNTSFSREDPKPPVLKKSPVSPLAVEPDQL